MAFFYYQQGGESYQVEADSYLQGAPADDSSLGILYSNGFEYKPPGIINDPLTTPVLGALSYSITAASTSPTGYRITYRNCAGETITDSYFPGSLEIPRTGVCSGDCETKFITGGTTILTLNSCPEILGDPRNPGCRDCCRELLPLIRGLSL